MPAFYVNGNGGFNFGYALNINQCNCPLKETENHFQWVNNWMKTKGNHSFGWGMDIRRAQQQRIPSDSHRSGEINFSDGETGSATVDGVATPIATADVLLRSVPIAPGHHRVEFTYRTPLLRPGVLLSLLSWLAWLALFWHRRAATPPQSFSGPKRTPVY